MKQKEVLVRKIRRGGASGRGEEKMVGIKTGFRLKNEFRCEPESCDHPPMEISLDSYTPSDKERAQT